MNNINKASLLAVNNLGDSLLNQTKPGEPAIVLSTSVFTLAVQKHTTAEFPGTRLSMPDLITEFVVPKKMKSITGPDVSTKVSGSIQANYTVKNEQLVPMLMKTELNDVNNIVQRLVHFI